MKSELGWLLFQLSGNADRALIYLEQARRLDDEVPRRRRLDEGQRTDLFERLARVELVAGDYPAAITHSQVALAAEPRRGELSLLASAERLADAAAAQLRLIAQDGFTVERGFGLSLLL